MICIEYGIHSGIYCCPENLFTYVCITVLHVKIETVNLNLYLSQYPEIFEN